MDYKSDLNDHHQFVVKFRELKKVGDSMFFDESVPKRLIVGRLASLQRKSNHMFTSCMVNSGYAIFLMGERDKSCKPYFDGVANRKFCLDELRKLKKVGDRVEFENMNRNTLRGYIAIAREGSNLILHSCLVNDKYVVIAVGVKDE